MTIQVKEFDLLAEIYKHHRPMSSLDSAKKRLAKEDKPLMQRLLEAGYPLKEMDHHESDLYVYVTPITTEVIEQWCKEHEYDRTWHCQKFFDQITGHLMYDCAFQYTDWWTEKMEHCNVMEWS